MKRSTKAAAIITATACVFSQAAVFAADHAAAVPQKTEISFRIGDDNLIINGKETKVEKPYVVGEGVTLVPLRVITEAFGATVEWNGEFRSIKITYPDVDIVLQIDNPIAEVNGKAETLLSAPELTEQGFTMVPLRFISETFGATVDWDGATQSVLVTKDNTSVNAVELEGAITEANIGDSYYKWTMENPKNMYMDKRNFDGSYTTFVYDKKNVILISISTLDKDYDFEKDFSDQKDKLKGYTLVKADKGTEGKVKTMHFQARDKEKFLNLKYFITDKYMIDVVGNFENDNTEVKDEALRVMDTFVSSYTGKDTYDLSNVENGTRRFEPDNLNFSIQIPQDYFMTSDEDSPNEFRFDNKDGSTIHIGVFSKSDTVSAAVLAEKDREGNITSSNENLYKYTEIRENAYRTFNAVEYSYTKTGGKKADKYFRDVFFEKGDYVFNIGVSIIGTGGEAEQAASEIFNSIETGTPDAEKLGILMRNDYDTEGKFTAKGSGWSVELPNSFKELSKQGDKVFYIDATSGMMISFGMVTELNNSADAKRLVQSVESESRNTTGKKVVRDMDTEVLGQWTCYSCAFSTETDEEKIYNDVYAFYCKGHTVAFFAVYPEDSYSAANMKKMREIVSSYKEN